MRELGDDTKWCYRHTHMGPELQNSFKEGTSGQLYGKLTIRHHVFRKYVPPNQTRPVFGLFGLQSWLTSRHVCGHVTRTTCTLRAPVDRPWVVDDVRHWNFSICYSNIEVMALLVEGGKCKSQKKKYFVGSPIFLYILWLYPSTKRAITPMFL